jgi:hypothetical protein
MTADFASIIEGLAAAGQTELGIICATEIPYELSNVALPIMVFEVGSDGVTYKDETLPGREYIGAPTSVTEFWMAHIVGSVIVGKPATAADYGAVEAAGREWYTRVRLAYKLHYRLGGLVYGMTVDSAKPGALKLADGWYMTVECDFHLQWKEVVPLSTG